MSGVRFPVPGSTGTLNIGTLELWNSGTKG